MQQQRVTAKTYSVYLAGPITGASYKTSTSWRQDVIDMLPVEIEAFSPLRAKTYLNQEQAVADCYDHLIMSSQRGIFARDSFDVERCDALFVNLLGAERVSIGTVMEIAWGWTYRKPMVVVMEEDNIHSHAMIREACPFIVRDLNEGISLLKNILLPVGH